MLVVYNMFMQVQQIWHPASSTARDLLQAVYYSCTEPNTEHTLRRYAKAYHDFPTDSVPAKVFEGTLSGGTYHYGTTYNLYLKGLPEDILQRCSMTEGEREKATLEYLRLTTLGLAVIGFGQASAPSAKTVPKLHFVGYICLQ